MINQYKKGFTLIELLVVVAIISLLSTIVLASLKDARLRAEDSRTIQQIREFQNAVALFITDEGRYPAIDSSSTNWPDGEYVVYMTCLAPQDATCYWGGNNQIPVINVDSNQDFAALDFDDNYFVKEKKSKNTVFAAMTNYLRYNLIKIPVVVGSDGRNYGGGILYRYYSGNGSYGEVLWATNKPISKGTNAGFSGGLVNAYYQFANDPGAGNRGLPAGNSGSGDGGSGDGSGDGGYGGGGYGSY